MFRTTSSASVVPVPLLYPSFLVMHWPAGFHVRGLTPSPALRRMTSLWQEFPCSIGVSYPVVLSTQQSFADEVFCSCRSHSGITHDLSLIHISEPTRQAEISY